MTSPLTCPKCGAHARVKLDSEAGGFIVRCKKCRLHGNLYSTIGNASKAWQKMCREMKGTK